MTEGENCVIPVECCVSWSFSGLTRHETSVRRLHLGGISVGWGPQPQNPWRDRNAAGKYWGCYDRFWMMFIVVVVCFLLRHEQVDQKSTTMSIFCFREVIINSLMSLAPWSAELLDEIQHGTFLMSRWRRPRIGRGKSGRKIKGKCCMLDLILGHPDPFMKCMNLSRTWISPWFRLVCDGGSSSVWRSSGAWAV